MEKPVRRVFRPAQTNGFVRNAVVNFDKSLSRSPIAYGYALAARHLVDRVLTDGHNQDFLVGPICFLYRHSAELGLKHIIEKGYELIGRSAGTPHHHNLRALWSEARALIVRVEPTSRPTARRIDGVIEELASVDPDSETFRYPSRDAKPSWPADVTHIDLQHLGEVMDELSELLEAAGDMLSSHVESLREWNAEMASLAAEYEREYIPHEREYTPDERDYGANERW